MIPRKRSAYRTAALITLTMYGLRLAAAEPTALPVRLRDLPLEIVGVDVTPHVCSRQLQYRQPPPVQLGALVRVVYRHSEPAGASLPLQVKFNQRPPDEWMQSGAWSWHETPANRGSDANPYELAPGAVDVLTFNAPAHEWGVGSEVQVQWTNARSGVTESTTLAIVPRTLTLSHVAFPTTDTEAEIRGDVPAGIADITPVQVVAHVVNRGHASHRLERLRVYAPDPDGQQAQGMRLVAERDASQGFRSSVQIPAKGRGWFWCQTGPLPLTHGLIELATTSAGGESHSAWAHLRLKVDRFDIGAGWLDIPSREGVVPLARESYLKLLKRMHVNLIHCEHAAGYTDAAGPDSLSARYPLRLMSGFSDLAKFNSDTMAPRVHGVDAVGEPQMGLGPAKTYLALKRYDSARFPTTVTLSEDAGFRHYAGLSDFPHFDAYRVTAPAADLWMKYNRWDGAKIFWGAPLEGVGEMTRTLKALSRPAPIAIWSQNVHEGWNGIGRRRRSPTPDEIAMQAYQGLANGVSSLYWYSLQSWSLLKYRDAIDVTTRLGRQMRAMSDFYVTGDSYRHERLGTDQRPELDLSSVVGLSTAALFALDLTYDPDKQSQEFRWRGPRKIDVAFELPDYLRGPSDLFRVDADGVHDVAWKASVDGVQLRDTLDRFAVYLVVKDGAVRQEIERRLAMLQAMETSVQFDPAGSDSDFQRLLNDLGFERLEDVGPQKGR